MSAPLSAPRSARPWFERNGPWLRFALGLGSIALGVFLLARTYRSELTDMGRWFFERLGLYGVALGTFLADGFHCPVPPQFYMLLGIAAGEPAAGLLAASAIGSLLGGLCGFALAQRIGNIPRLRTWIDRSSGRFVRAVSQRRAYESVLAISATPFAFSVLCYAAGLYRLRAGAFVLLLVLRVPKLLLYYSLVKLGWSG